MRTNAEAKKIRDRPTRHAHPSYPMVRVLWEDHTFLDDPAEAGPLVVEEVAFLLRRTPRYLIYAHTVNRGPGTEVEFDGVSQILVRDILSLEVLHPMGKPRVHCEKCGDELEGAQVAAVLCGPCWYGSLRR